jgi:hypothetical protein
MADKMKLFDYEASPALTLPLSEIGFCYRRYPYLLVK